MSKYLEENGLAYFWTKLKAYFAKKSEVLHLTGGTMTGTIDGTDIDLSGDIEADNATFAGDLSADDATFSGDISANDATLSGDIEAVKFTSNNQGFIIDLPTVEADVVPAETQYLHGLEFTDKNHLFLGGVQFIDNTDKNFQGMQIGISKSDWNEQLLMYLGLNNVTHNPYVLYTHPLAFLDALCHDGIYGRRSYVQYTGSDVVDLNSTYATLVSANMIRWGRLVWLKIVYTNKTTWSIGANGDTGNITIGKLKHFPPVENINLPSIGENSNSALKSFISSAGNISIVGGDATGAAYTVSANAQQIINVCYMCQNNTANLT